MISGRQLNLICAFGTLSIHITFFDNKKKLTKNSVKRKNVSNKMFFSVYVIQKIKLK